MENLAQFTPPRPESPHFEGPDLVTFGSANYLRQIEANDLARIKNSFNSLSEDDKEWIAAVHAKLGIKKSLADSITEGVKYNSDFLNAIVKVAIPIVYSNSVTRKENPRVEALEGLVNRTRSLPLVAAREWSSFSEERDITNKILRESVCKYVNVNDGPVLIPGCSSGRLVYDIASLGFSVVGIEHDPLRVMLMHSVFAGHKHSFFPYILDTCNRIKEQDNRIESFLPDIQIDTTILSRITIDANEFFESISTYPDNHFSAVVTSWFKDSPNMELEKLIVELKRVLKPNGLWVNFGPLDYSYVGEKGGLCQTNNKRSLEEIVEVMKIHKFSIVEESLIDSTFLHNPYSIMKTIYTCSFFVAKQQ